MFDGWVVCCNCKHCDTKADYMGVCELSSDFIFTDLPRICPYYIPAESSSTCEGFIKVNEDVLNSKEENTMNETGKIFDEISEILNKKNEEIEEINKKLIAFEAANKENKKLVERLDERISEKNREIEELNNKLINTRSEVNEANIRNNLLEFKNNSLVKDNLEHLEENRGLVEECGKLHDILCKNCKYDNDVDDVCFRACKCGSHFCPEESKELHKKIECLEEQNRGLAGEAMKLFGEKRHLAKEYEELKENSDQSIVELEKLVEEKNKEINSLNITKEFYINKAKDLAAERDDFSKKWDKSLCKLVEKEEEIDELKKQNDSVFYDILDSDTVGLPHYNYLTRRNRYPIYRYYGVNDMVTKNFVLVGYLYVKEEDKDVNLYSKTIGEVKKWAAGEDEVYEDDIKLVKIPRHQIAIVPMRIDGIEAAEKWVIE